MLNLDYLYNPAVAKKSFRKNYFVEKSLGFSVIENGTILPHKIVNITKTWSWKNQLGGILDNNQEFINGSFVHKGLGGTYTPPPENIQHSSETVIYLGAFYSVWGHAITDNIRRVWFLNSDVFKNEFKNCRIVYIPFLGSPLKRQQNFKRLLEILEVDVEKLYPITKPTRFDKIILPDESFYLSAGGRFMTSEYRETIDRIRDFALKNRTPTLSKKIYYFHGRKSQVGEERLAEYFKSKGYEIVHPEKLSLDEQLNLMINCESFASTLGSISHNSVFLRDDTECIFIPRFCNEFTGYQQTLNQVHPVNAFFIDSSLSIFFVSHSTFCYVISPQLRRFFGDNFDGYAEDDFKIFLQYFKNAESKGLEVNLRAKERYASILQDFMEQLKQREDLIAAYNMPLGWEKLRPLLTYRTHVHKDGWCSWQNEEQISNPLDKKRDIQAIKINFSTHKVYYSVYYNDEEGWSEEVAAPETVGTIGKRKSIYGMRIRFDEAGAKEFDILYRVHKFDNTWTHWAKNGEALYSHGVKLNAIQIKLESKPIPAKKTEVMPQP